jgi:YD repeat-containing protein
LRVSWQSLAVEDRKESVEGTMPLTTTSSFNRNGELVTRSFPGGDAVAHTYDDNNPDPRDQGNLLEVRKTPGGVTIDHPELRVCYSYASGFQQVGSLTDPRGNKALFEYDERGNLTKKMLPAVTVPNVSVGAGGGRTSRKAKLFETFEYNAAGQLIRSTDGRGAGIEYFYHPAEQPGGETDSGTPPAQTQSPGGYLARMVVDTPGKSRRLKSPPAQVSTQYFLRCVRQYNRAARRQRQRHAFPVRCE